MRNLRLRIIEANSRLLESVKNLSQAFADLHEAMAPFVDSLAEEDQKAHEAALSIHRGLAQARKREFVSDPDLEADRKIIEGSEDE